MKLLLSRVTGRQLKAIEQAPGGSYLFIGPVGTGKFTAAKQLGKKISARPGDVIIIEPAKKSIGIEQVLDLGQSLRLKNTGGGRTVIILQAQLLTREAQNALLKMLEEPPLDTTIILTASQIDSLVATVLSRCQKILFPPLGQAAIRSYLVQPLGLPVAEASRLANVSEGATGAAITLSRQPERLQEFENRLKLAKNYLQQPLYERLLLNQQILAEEDPTQMVLQILKL